MSSTPDDAAVPPPDPSAAPDAPGPSAGAPDGALPPPSFAAPPPPFTPPTPAAPAESTPAPWVPGALPPTPYEAGSWTGATYPGYASGGPLPPQPGAPRAGMSTGAKVGIGFAVGCGAVLVGLGIVVFAGILTLLGPCFGINVA